ncbi:MULTISPECIES: hypothetical protein [Pseudanabaena]|uniref:CRISPR-associated protein n=2 Tax=Pseudanabaena TaxID=1152 RepID=L8MYU4_9CYAN|nr:MULTISPECIES: hypothetical protein [Pseudanabaena]ELS32671.1 hypothetical protein Pse7429DRAFT_2155 [Pseudanabaena biceps PCC 7429]MDG3495097.1 hypothetical protein [Pseudanabaena catenata USMAC16]
MSIVWIVTTGNSDVKLTDDTGWGALRIKKMEQLYPCENEFSPTPESNSDLLTLPARVMGIAYGDAIETYWERLTFPLLDGFCQEFKTDKKNKPDRIIVLLTDQEAIFDDYSRGHLDSPYWQDTYTLQPILKHYFTQEFGERFANEKIEFSVLKPQQGADGLDDWDATLTLVKAELAKWEENKWISKSDRVIVSHQAGTPAISSAVQLTCLIRFGKKVEFLVSSELPPNKTKFLKGSSYFETLQFKKLEDLLDRHDYSGMTSIVEEINFESDEIKSRLLHLLKLANFWNAVEFEKFATAMGEAATSRSKEWWWSAYESAYLAVVRLKQENTVEAMFHSFRAVEGLLSMWLDEFHFDKKEGKKIKLSSEFTLPSGNKTRYLNAYGQGLYFALVVFKGVDVNSDADIWNFGNKVFDKRNELFHKLEGLQDRNSVFKAWEIFNDNEKEWKTRVLNCLNFISQEEFKSIEEASLMSQVHKDLKEVIKEIAY